MSSSSRSANRRECLLALAVAPALARAQSPGLPELPPDWTARGQARMRFLGLRIYDVQLWAAEPLRNWAEQPHALALTYARSLKGRLIAERSLDEMRRQGPIDEATGARWLQAMTAAFPDVKEGDRLTGRHDPDQGARFWFNGQPRPGVADPVFSRLFFGIWLSPKTSEPALREQLLR
jgi:hypothetical protein